MRALIIDDYFKADYKDYDAVFLINKNEEIYEEKYIFCSNLGVCTPAHDYSRYCIVAQDFSSEHDLKKVILSEYNILEKKFYEADKNGDVYYYGNCNSMLYNVLLSALRLSPSIVDVRIGSQTIFSNFKKPFKKVEITKEINKIDKVFSKFFELNVECKIAEKTAVFTVVDENYIDYAVRALSIFKNNNNFDCYVVTDADYHERSGIKGMRVDLSNEYKTEEDWPYPSHCFWIFDIPERLLDLGYDNSIYIDSDVISLKPMNDIMPSIDGVGITIDKSRGKNSRRISRLSNYQKVKEEFKINERVDGYITHTGVVLFDNLYAKKYLSKQMQYIFNRSKEIGEPRHGDDSLFSLYSLITNYKDIKQIDKKLNFLEYHHIAVKKSPDNTVVNYHALGNKPWSKECNRRVRKIWLSEKC